MLRKKPPIAQKDGISNPQLTEFKSQIVVDVFWEVYVFRHFVHIQVVTYMISEFSLKETFTSLTDIF